MRGTSRFCLWHFDYVCIYMYRLHFGYYWGFIWKLTCRKPYTKHQSILAFIRYPMIFNCFSLTKKYNFIKYYYVIQWKVPHHEDVCIIFKQQLISIIYLLYDLLACARRIFNFLISSATHMLTIFSKRWHDSFFFYFFPFYIYIALIYRLDVDYKTIKFIPNENNCVFHLKFSHLYFE